MKGGRDESQSAPLTLGQALTGCVRLVVWCKTCQRRIKPDIAEKVERCGEATTVIDLGGMPALLCLRRARCRFRRHRGAALTCVCSGQSPDRLEVTGDLPVVRSALSTLLPPTIAAIAVVATGI